MDKTKYENKMLVINKSGVPIHGLQPEAERIIRVDKNGTPIDRLWRKRKNDNDGNFIFKEIEYKKPKKKERSNE